MHPEEQKARRSGREAFEFADPLDLLLYLIRREQANIFDIPVARITDKYLEYIRLMERLDIAVAVPSRLNRFQFLAAVVRPVRERQVPTRVRRDGVHHCQDLW